METAVADNPENPEEDHPDELEIIKKKIIKERIYVQIDKLLDLRNAINRLTSKEELLKTLTKFLAAPPLPSVEGE
jgi:hypothetical protein